MVRKDADCRHRRCGALYPGRFKAVLVEELGSEGWVEPWRQRLAEQPDTPAIPGPHQLAWRPTVEDVVQAVCHEFAVQRTAFVARRRRGNDSRLASGNEDGERKSIPDPRCSEAPPNFSRMRSEIWSRRVCCSCCGAGNRLSCTAAGRSKSLMPTPSRRICSRLAGSRSVNNRADLGCCRCLW